MEFNKELILAYQKNSGDFLMIDYATEVLPGKSAKGYKLLPDNLWFFKLHWPGDPNMPGVLQIESMTQLCSLAILSLPGLKGETMYLLKINNVRFFSKVLPEKKLELETHVKSFNRGIADCHGIGHQGDKKVCSADFSMMLAKFKDKIITPQKCQ